MGDTANYTCISLLGAATIEWLDVNDSSKVLKMDSEVTQLGLVLNRVAPSIQGRVYACRVTIGGSNTIQSVVVTIQGEPTFIHGELPRKTLL